MSLIRKSVNRQITEKLDADGIEYSFGTDEHGAIRIIVSGESLSPGEAADKFLPGGFVAAYGKEIFPS